MILRLLPIFILVIVFSGCASSQLKTQNDQIQSRLTDVEKDLQAKDAQIVDLQYQVKDLSSKIDTSKTVDADQASASSPETQNMQSSPDQTEGAQPAVAISSSQIIRVNVSPEKIQRALKSAGVYTGPIDGKIGPGTKAAIVEFQKSHDLKADGVLGKRTWDVLKTFLK